MANAIGLTYQSYLEREFKSRSRRNPGYSLRAFARDLGIAPSKLSEALRGVCGLSRESALKIGSKLNLSAQEQDFFVSLVEASHSRSKLGKTLACEKLNSLKAQYGFNQLDLERFQIIADWHHFSILELTEIKDFSSDPQWIAERLGISIAEVLSSIERLLDFGLLERSVDGSLRQTQIDLATPSGIPSRALKEHHSQLMQKAEASLFNHDVSERDINSITMAIDSTRMGEAKEYLKEFRRRFCKDMQEGANKDRVYCLSIQFFPVDQKQVQRAKTNE